MKWKNPDLGETRWRRKFCWLPETCDDGCSHWLEFIWIQEEYQFGPVSFGRGIYLDVLHWHEVRRSELREYERIKPPIPWPSPRPLTQETECVIQTTPLTEEQKQSVLKILKDAKKQGTRLNAPN